MDEAIREPAGHGTCHWDSDAAHFRAALIEGDPRLAALIALRRLSCPSSLSLTIP